jgi:hypothetical protein
MGHYAKRFFGKGVPREGLVAEYLFNGNANDTSGNGYNGIVTGATLTTGRKGFANTAYQFSLNTDIITLQNTQNLNFQNAFTISFWIFSENLQPSGYPRIITKENIFSAYIVLRKYCFFGSGTDVSFPTGTNNHSVWEFGAYVFDGSKVKLYINGFYISEITRGTLSANTTLITIGNNPANFRFYRGIIDSIRIYDRPLNDSEIMSLYNE